MTDNELIAEFMGGSLEKRDFITIGGKRTGKWTFPDRTWCYDDQLQYSKRWDWLMPVVEKIKNMTPDLFNYNVKSMTEFRRWYAQIQSISIFTPIDKVYTILINFIKWYNENKTK